MIHIRRILFPTDFSDAAAEAQLYACALAEQFDAELHVLSVMLDVAIISPDPNVPWMLPVGTDTDTRTALEEMLLKVPNADWSVGKIVHRVIRVGTPKGEILAYAREHEIDLIVVGSHGRTGFTHLLLGSVAEDVTRQSPCPVLTVHPKGHQFVDG